MQNKRLKGYLLSILSAAIYSLMRLIAKYVYADGVNALTLVFLSNFLALPSLALFAYIKYRTLKFPLKSLPTLSLLSFFSCCITPILLFSSYNYMATGTTTVSHFVYPSLAVLIGIIFLKNRESLFWYSYICF